MTAVTPNLLRIDRDSPAFPCEGCGYPTARVAAVINEAGEIQGRTVVCTRCQPPRDRP